MPTSLSPPSVCHQRSSPHDAQPYRQHSSQYMSQEIPHDPSVFPDSHPPPQYNFHPHQPPPHAGPSSSPPYPGQYGYPPQGYPPPHHFTPPQLPRHSHPQHQGQQQGQKQYQHMTPQTATATSVPAPVSATSVPISYEHNRPPNEPSPGSATPSVTTTVPVSAPGTHPRTPPPPTRGRPKGSKNKATLAKEAAQLQQQQQAAGHGQAEHGQSEFLSVLQPSHSPQSSSDRPYEIHGWDCLPPMPVPRPPIEHQPRWDDAAYAFDVLHQPPHSISAPPTQQVDGSYPQAAEGSKRPRSSGQPAQAGEARAQGQHLAGVGVGVGEGVAAGGMLCDSYLSSASSPEETEAGLGLSKLKRRNSSVPAQAGKKKKTPVKMEDDLKPVSGAGVKTEANGTGNKTDKADGRKSCAECRRLKAKCDRQFPCSNCRRRGCALVCPDGDLSCMQGKRLVLASTEQLHERIVQLETALFQAHKKTETTSHPLLAPEYLDGGFASLPSLTAPIPVSTTQQQTPPTESPSSAFAQPPSRASHASLADPSRSPKNASSAGSFAIATPLIGVERPSSSVGRITVESLLTEESSAPEGKREDEWAGENAAPAMIIGTVGSGSDDDDLDQRHRVFERLKKILKVLPSREETRRRADHFWATSQWYQTVLHREEFESIYEPAVYAPTSANPLSPHKLAAVLMVLTLDSYLDISTEEENPIVADYWDAAQRCFDTRFGWAASLAGVQALALATLFVGFGWRGTHASNFYWLRQMTSAALQLGLHRDAHPSFSDEEREFRRRVFHEVYVLDCLICLNHGQRPTIPIEYIEAAYPKNGTTLSYKKYDFMRLVKSQVIDIGSLPDSSPAPWEKVNEVKQRLMHFDASTIPIVHCPLLRGEPLPEPVTGFTAENAKELQTTTTSMCHYKAMLYLFRPSLRRLIARIRSQPNSVVFDDNDRETVSMTYRACHAITLTSYYMTHKHPRLMARAWMVWVQTFSAAVSMAALAIWCGPHLEKTFVESVYQELCEACDMIGENGSKRSLGVLSLLPILKSLVYSRYPQVIGNDPADSRPSPDGEDMLFALLGGQVDTREQQQQQQQRSQQALQQRQLASRANTGKLDQEIDQLLESGSTVAMDQPPPMLDAVSAVPRTGAFPEHNGAVAFNSAPQQQQVPTLSTPQSWYVQSQPEGCGSVVLPLASTAPNAVPFDTFFPLSVGADVQGEMVMLRNAPELWQRLQAFYEPAPPFSWQGGVSVGGFVDYTGPMY